MTRRECMVVLASLVPVPAACSAADGRGARLLGQASLASGRRLVPDDDGVGHAAFVAFRTQLRQAVSKRDASFLQSVLDPNVRVRFGPDERGHDAFHQVWRPDDPKSELWPQLDAILPLAAVGGPDSFWIPYVYADWPAEFDPLTHAAVVSDNVVLRESANADGGAVARLSYHMVRLLDSASGDWRQVSVPGGVTGYVPSASLVSPVGLRLQCVNTADGWRIATLISGD